MTNQDENIPRTLDLSLLSGGARRRVRLDLWEESPEAPGEVKLRLEFNGRIIEKSSECGFFQALYGIRTELEKEGALLECYGCSENVYPSPMIEAMGYGEKAYRLTMGQQARTADLVSIFDSGTDIFPVSIMQQRNYYQRWLESLK